MFNRVSFAHSDANRHIADDINFAASYVTPPHTNQNEARLEGDLMRELGVCQEDTASWVDIEGIMNPFPFTVQAGCPLPKVIQLFCGMGLRHLPVLDANSQVVGIITRKDLHDGVPRLKAMLESAPYVEEGLRRDMTSRPEAYGELESEGKEQLLSQDGGLNPGARDSFL
eukprot:TRINITY_DN21142_c0_g1_i6.p1 TRINITY_DN21142_c0_g1~~TRINITY_DN21142_c0_g1_i6.p1  ORF type:complete len:170 (+),score=30.70 TRINITY_DN21142_c0_g1_i6:312-821(+)